MDSKRKKEYIVKFELEYKVSTPYDEDGAKSLAEFLLKTNVKADSKVVTVTRRRMGLI